MKVVTDEAFAAFLNEAFRNIPIKFSPEGAQEIRAALESFAAQRDMGWQPIETAPRDELVLLGWWFAPSWSAPSWEMDIGEAEHETCAAYWHPLPTPPARDPSL